MSELPTESEQEARRQALLAYIEANFGGSVNAFATAMNRSQPHIRETLNGQKSFGEKLARKLEAEIAQMRQALQWRHLPPLQFDAQPGRTALLQELIDLFQAIPNEHDRQELVDIARLKTTKSGLEAASTQVGRDSPARGLGPLQPAGNGTPKKRRRA